VLFVLFTLTIAYCVTQARQEDSVKVASQNPSPMVDHTRSHQRIEQSNIPASPLN